ncbi:MAG TPA: hypothetical protein VMV46_03110 [Thermoanaerobaculia bacterium]|nr:hypothetical protein [Thermoanaerobaculia bacterium]
MVGGAAVELYTNGAYVSGDLDFVGSPSEALERALKEAGFERAGRHWLLSAKRVFVEFPSTEIGSQQTVELQVGELRLCVLAPEDLIIDRLAGFQFWQSEVDFENAVLLFRHLRDEIDRKRLARAARSAGVSESVRRLLDSVEAT